MEIFFLTFASPASTTHHNSFTILFDLNVISSLNINDSSVFYFFFCIRTSITWKVTKIFCNIMKKQNYYEQCYLQIYAKHLDYSNNCAYIHVVCRLVCMHVRTHVYTRIKTYTFFYRNIKFNFSCDIEFNFYLFIFFFFFGFH
jgi:hypothetical protein